MAINLSYQKLPFMTRSARACSGVAFCAFCAFATLLTQIAMGASSTFRDVLETPSTISAIANKNLLQTVVSNGKKLFAVGQRGHILISTDEGQSWKQAKSPISSDFIAIATPDDTNLWVTGHDGTVLHSADAGETWQVQMDGNKANDLMVKSLTTSINADPSNDRLKKLLNEAQFYKQEGATKPFMGVWFSDAQHGVVVGAYGLIFVTNDGGKNWESWFDVIDNPTFLHYNAIAGNGSNVYIAGEAGNVWHVDLAQRKAIALKTPYEGSFFDIATDGKQLVTVGMRGNVWHQSLDHGVWEKSKVGVNAGITHILMHQNQYFITTQNGKVLLSRDEGKTFSPLTTKFPMVYAGIAIITEDNQSWKAALVGISGVRMETIAKP